jgi:hypothetical protein
MLGLTRSAPATGLASASSCRQCGAAQPNPSVTFCRRCGIPFGAAPSAEARLPSCPVCYQTVDDLGLLPPLGGLGPRRPISDHLADHERYPVGDDDWLESLRVGDRIRVGDGWAPFDLVRRYLVTGLVDAGRGRQVLHDAVVTAISQLARWGNAEVDALGDQEEWRAAREAVTRLMERYHRDR